MVETLKIKNRIPTQFIALRFSFLICYIIFSVAYFYKDIVYFDFFVINLIITSIILWLGPLQVIGKLYVKIYDPSIVLFCGIFYYMFKGFSLAFGEKTIILNSLPFSKIYSIYIEICILILISAIILSFSYRRVKIYIRHERKTDNISLGLGYYAIISVGLFSLFFLLKSLNFNLFSFLLYPNLRGYMGVDSTDSQGGLSFFYYYGFQLLGIALLAKLVVFGQNNKKPTIIWYFITGIFSLLLFLLTPRATLLCFITAVMIVYHLRIKKINSLVLVTFLIIGAIYIYVVNLWRGIVGSTSTPNIGIALRELQSIANLNAFIDKIMLGTDLSDIRMFILIRNCYGEVLPLKYGATLLRIIYQFIPRFLWKNKPLDLGVEIGQLFLPGTKSGTPPGFFAEMYMNFSVPGVLIGAFVLGCLLKFILSAWGNLRLDKNLFYFAIVVPRVFLIPSSSISNLCTTLIIFILGAFICIEIHFMKLNRRSKE